MVGKERARPVRVHRYAEGNRRSEDDRVAVEEPLEIRVAGRSVSITMRTPGHDRELAAGFLFTEGILRDPRAVADIIECGGGNVARVELAAGTELDLRRLERHFYTTSSCGVCGKTSLEALAVQGLAPLTAGVPRFAAQVLPLLPERLRAAQSVFDETGGLHAAALFDARGELLLIREDIGRHNAVDKVIGSAFLAGGTPLSESLLLVSGRASFELMQKALVAGIPLLAAVGAPSSLAVELARRFEVTLVGFLRGRRFNVYHGGERLEGNGGTA